MKFYTQNKYLEMYCSLHDKDNFGEHISLPVTALFKLCQTVLKLVYPCTYVSDAHHCKSLQCLTYCTIYLKFPFVNPSLDYGFNYRTFLVIVRSAVIFQVVPRWFGVYQALKVLICRSQLQFYTLTDARVILLCDNRQGRRSCVIYQILQ